MTENRLTVPTNPARALRDLNRQAPITPQERDIGEEQDTQNYTTILQSDKPTNSQTDQLTYKPTNKQTDIPTSKQVDKPTNQPSKKRAAKLPAAPERQETAARTETAARPARVDGRTLRPRQDTADQTMVTSMRLAVSTLELLDDYCYRHRQRKQDVIQAALDLYFAAEDAENE